MREAAARTQCSNSSPSDSCAVQWRKAQSGQSTFVASKAVGDEK